MLGRLRCNIAAFGILGNHDSWRDVSVIRRRLRRIGMRVLPNTWESLDVRGASRATSHYRIDTERNRIELWYSPEGEWLGLRSTTRDGHVLSYRLR